MGIVIRLVINAIGLYAAAYLVEGISWEGNGISSLFVVALVFGLINALIKPILQLLSLPLLLVTLGLFTLVINALMLMLTGALVSSFTVNGFVAALLGSIIISVISSLLSNFVPDGNKKHK